MIMCEGIRIPLRCRVIAVWYIRADPYECPNIMKGFWLKSHGTAATNS